MRRLIKKWSDEQESLNKIIPDWRMVREYIDKIKDEEIKNSLKILYLFHLSVSELAKENSKDEGLKGIDVNETIVNGEPALALKIRTNNRGQKIRHVFIPLNPKYEPWSKDILNYCENISNDLVYHKVDRVLEDEFLVNIFLNFNWYAPRYREKISKYADEKKFTSKNLIDLRDWELALCHNFTQNDFDNFLGKEYHTDYSTYFNKLINKNDYYIYEDIINAIKLRELVFCPKHEDKWDMKEFMDVVKKIKRKLITQTGPFELKIKKDNINEYKNYKGHRETDEHTILKKNMFDYLIEKYKSNINDIKFELSSFDVVDLKNKIIVECGNSNPVKLLDGFNDVLEGVIGMKEFWVVQFLNPEGSNICYKFIKNEFMNFKQNILP
jgi:hypothetical protein